MREVCCKRRSGRYWLRLPLLCTVILTIAVGTATSQAEPSDRHDPLEYDVVVVGGSTAALAAAIHSAQSGANTALLEPTDWVGGQLTASGVPAIDEAWHKITAADSDRVVIDVSKVARDPRNMTPMFRDLLLATPEDCDCWVSRYCFEPKPFLQKQLSPLVEQAGERLDVYLNTVIKTANANQQSRKVKSVLAIQRTAKNGAVANGYDRLPSEDLTDWYSPTPSDRFDKRVLTIRGDVFIDASEWGELLALANAAYRIGVEVKPGSSECDESCGQAITYAFVQRMVETPIEENVQHEPIDGMGLGAYSDRPDAWNRIWTYRRIRGGGSRPNVGDLSLQNWGYSKKLGNGGNDYPFAYLFKNRKETAAEQSDWTGGVHVDVLAAAEQRALAWHTWFKNHAPEPFKPGQILLDGASLGTDHGLAKLPYIRDTRRSVGINGFVLTLPDLCGEGEDKTGVMFDDRIALGAYAADIHPLVRCDYPDYVTLEQTTRPFAIPFRSLTNQDYDNMLVAGKTMAQTFMANSATRLHPIEWSTGTAAGVIAADMVETSRTAHQIYDNIESLQAKVKQVTPIDWTIDDTKTDR